MKKVSTAEFDRAFDAGEDITPTSTSPRHPPRQRRLPCLDGQGFDARAAHLSITRHAPIRMWIADRLERLRTRRVPTSRRSASSPTASGIASTSPSSCVGAATPSLLDEVHQRPRRRDAARSQGCSRRLHWLRRGDPTTASSSTASAPHPSGTNETVLGRDSPNSRKLRVFRDHWRRPTGFGRFDSPHWPSRATPTSNGSRARFEDHETDKIRQLRSDSVDPKHNKFAA